jgi:hypothetical protein
MGERPGLAAAGTSHHQQWPLVVIHRLALGVVEAGEKSLRHQLERSPTMKNTA